MFRYVPDPAEWRLFYQWRLQHDHVQYEFRWRANHIQAKGIACRAYVFNESATHLGGNWKTMGGGAGKDEGPINHSLGIFFWLALTLCHFNVQIIRTAKYACFAGYQRYWLLCSRSRVFLKDPFILIWVNLKTSSSFIPEIQGNA